MRGLAADLQEIFARMDGRQLLNNLGIDPTDGSILNRALTGEKMCDAVVAECGWEPFGSFSDKHPFAGGLDRVYYNPATGRYTIVEAKFAEGDANFSNSRLMYGRQNQLSDEGIKAAIPNSVNVGTLTKPEADTLLQALNNRTIDKELVIVKNNYDGKTVARSVGDDLDIGSNSLNPVNTTIIEFDKILPKPW